MARRRVSGGSFPLKFDSVRLQSKFYSGFTMLAEERRFQIREVLAAHRTVTAKYLCEMLQVTAVTIRRDLEALEREGLLVRSHGGAVSRMSSTNFQPSYDALARSNTTEKLQIARAAEQFILDGDTVFLEGSTTVFELARLLARRHRLTVVTNSPSIVCELQHSPGVVVMCTGGALLKDTFYLAGDWTQRALSEIRLDKAILGVSAVDPHYGISTASHEEAQIKKMIMQAAKTRIALADNGKFGKQSFAYVGPVTDISILVTDSKTDARHIKALQDFGLQVIIAESQVATAKEKIQTKNNKKS